MLGFMWFFDTKLSLQESADGFEFGTILLATMSIAYYVIQ